MAGTRYNNSGLTADRLRKLFHYDPETGVFTRLVSTSNSTKIGEVMQPDRSGYVRFSIDWRKHFAHRLAWLYMTGEWPAEEIDHKDRNPSNNRWSNLRPATFKENHENSIEQRNNTSGRRGVQWFKNTGKWWARISHHGRRISLGYYASKAEAIEVRELAEAMLYTHTPMEMIHG